jgi:hypothetical protein
MDAPWRSRPSTETARRSPIELSVARNHGSGPSAYTAIIRDISDHRQVRQELQRTSSYVDLVREVATLANEVDSVADAVERIMGAVCAVTGDGLGHLLCVEPTMSLRSSGIWHTGGTDLGDFTRLSESLLYRPGIGPGKALEERAAVFMHLAETGSIHAYRAQMAIRSGFMSVLVVRTSRPGTARGPECGGRADRPGPGT